MLLQTITSVTLIASLLSPMTEAFPSATFSAIKEPEILSSGTFNLTNRLLDRGGNPIFTDNILLTLRYFQDGSIKAEKKNGPGAIDWEKVREPFEFSFILLPGETFTFHSQVLPEYEKHLGFVGKGNFSWLQGYKALEGLSGNGVCHLASFINWVANDAHLDVDARVNHNFAPVPDVPKQYGTSIFDLEGSSGSKLQNLYITNKFTYPVKFTFKVNGEEVRLVITK